MNVRTIDWLSEWKRCYSKEIHSWNAKYPDIDREYITFYPCDVKYLDSDEILTELAGKERELHLYIHIPFCKYLCPFCFFNKYQFDINKVKAYVKALKKEIFYYSRKPYMQNYCVISVYFGGGTPTVLSSKQILEIIQYMRKYFNISKNAEIAIETTPLNINERIVKELTMKDVNRISIGIQSFNNTLLQSIFLLHKGESCARIIKAIKDFGINVSIDLMYRLPNQTLFDWERDLSLATNLNVDTISCYSFELPPPVKEKKFANVSLPKIEDDIEMNNFAIDYLRSNNYRQYTIADFCLPQKESSYVMNCWKAPQHEYLGFGPGAHSFLGGYVFYNIASLKSYFEWIKKGKLPILFGKKLIKEEAMSRYFVLGVKCLSVDLQKFEQIFNVKAFKLYGKIFSNLQNKGLIKLDKTQLQLTRKGLIYVDNISKSFYTLNNKGKPQPVGILLQNMKPTNFTF